MKRLSRLYRVSDNKLLEAAKVMRMQFLNDQAQMAAFDANLGNPFEMQWQQAIDQCETHVDDETVRDQLQIHTAKVKAAMKACRTKFTDSKYFIKKAFPDNLEMWHSFGFDTFRPETGQQTGMIQFMGVFHLRATQQAAALNAVGYDNAAIDEIDTLRLALIAANSGQESFKGARPVKTAHRKKDFNALWQIMRTVNQVARSVFRNDPIKKGMYQLPVPEIKKKTEETEANDLPSNT